MKDKKDKKIEIGLGFLVNAVETIEDGCPYCITEFLNHLPFDTSREIIEKINDRKYLSFEIVFDHSENKWEKA